MHRTRTKVLGAVGAIVLALSALSCSDKAIIAPNAARPAPGAASRDETPGAFTWLTPLGTSTADPATFDPAAVSRVVVCLWTGGACTGSPVAQFATTPASGVGSLAANITVGRYEATWSLLSTSFLARRTYRISAQQGSTEVGAVLVDVVRGRWALTRSDGTLAPLAAANELPIQFHVAFPPPVLTAIVVSVATPLVTGQTATASAQGVDQRGAPFPTGPVTWSSTDEAIAKVNAAGVVTAVSAGPATIVATAGGVSGQQAITVNAPPAIKINEVESNGGTPGDWAELYNPTTSAVDISGWLFRDNDPTHGYHIPAGTIIPAGGYYLVEEAAFGFGLGAADDARLYNQFGAPVDSYTWTAHAATTYARCPNGVGAFETSASSTKGAANDCVIPGSTVKINEIESSGGTPGDWIELFNTGTVAVDLSGFVVKDNDDTHISTIPAGTILAPGGYYIVEEAALGFGLGSPDAARLYNKAGTLIDSFGWSPHAVTTYARCPNGTGAFATSASSTKGAANDCGAGGTTVKINEVESSGGTPGDWIELLNTGTAAVNLTGFVLKDNDDTHIMTFPAGTTIAPGAFLVVEEASLGFGLGEPDAARLFNNVGTLIDSYEWTTHAATTYGRCPDGAGAFVTTVSSTKGTANACPSTGPTAAPWPGSDDVVTVDALNAFTSNLSGLVFEAGIEGAPDVLWAARNGPGSIYRLIFDGTIWTPDPANGWGAGKGTRYTDGTGEPDTEDLTFTTGSLAGMYIVSERNNSANSVSRPSILRYDVTGTGATLTATNEWNLTADLPSVAANSGLEGITWVPDAYLVSHGFVDVAAGHLYNPAEYADHGSGLFFVGLEGNGVVYVYALNHVTNGFKQIASFSTGFPNGVMALQFDRELGQLWATCDDTCGGLSDIFEIDTAPGSPTLGRFKLTHIFARPSTMPNINNEGFAFGPQSSCVAGKKPVFWSDDSNTGGHAIRRASIPCAKFP